MRITALVKSPSHVCCRYRIAAFRPALAAAGFQLEPYGWPGSWLSRLLFHHNLRHTDALLVQRKLLPAWQLKLVRQRVGHLLYDFDDAVFLHNSYDQRGPSSPGRLRRFHAMLDAADAVIAGNEFLYEHAVERVGPEKVHLIPTCIDPARYPLAAHDPAERHVRLVWIGSASTLEGMGRFRPVLEELGKSFRALQLRIVCDRSLSLDHLPVLFSPWHEETEARDIAAGEVGVSWLPDDEWSEGKCGLKILQYMAAGLPVVANPVGPHLTLIRPGETGFLAESPDEWQQAIQLLASDATLRRQMGQAARRLVETSYSVTQGASAWRHILSNLSPRPALSA